MSIQPYAASSRTEIDDLLTDAKALAKTYDEIEQWALRSVPNHKLRRYCMDQAKQRLGI